MKETMVALALLFFLHTQAQNDSAEIQIDSVEVHTSVLPDSTGMGAPDGKSVSKEIGTRGGTIISDDGRVELLFPEGALTATTRISIQPVTSSIQNANGNAYQFEPSGIQFQKPVQLIFHYSDREGDICPPELKFMAVQDHNGKWKYMNYDEWDSSGKSLKGFISHFSAFLDGMLMELSPVDTTLKVGKSFPLILTTVVAPGEDELPPLPVRDSKRKITWFVKGGVRFGTIKADKYLAIYTAPRSLNTVNAKVVLKIDETTIREVLQRSKKWRGATRIPETRNLATFTCNINLYDEYKVRVNMDWGRSTDMRWVDSSSFLLRIGEQVSISDIQNMMFKVIFGKQKCKPIYVNEATCTGMINVTGVNTASVTPAAAGQQFAKVDISFQPAPLCMPSFHWPPCGINKASPTFPGVFAAFAFPVRISFQAKNERQLVNMSTGMVVKKADPEDIIATVEPVRN